MPPRPATPSVLPLHRVGADGRVVPLGHWDRAARRLVLTAPGFPLAAVGEHAVEGTLPWPLVDMAPSGFLGRRFGRAFPGLALPVNLVDARDDDIVNALTTAGHDLSGNLLVGDLSRTRYLRNWSSLPYDYPTVDEAPERFARFVRQDQGAVFGGASSLGGERPKFSQRLADGRGWLVKYTPPLSSPFGPRWADILRVELHAADTLRAHGLDAVTGRIFVRDDRLFLALDRFDRLAGGGRRGAVTWFWLGASRYGLNDAPSIAAALRQDGYIPADDYTRFVRAHSLAAAMGNNDTHAGNYGLTVDDDGAHRLAPLYDLAPMALAPRYDELPDPVLTAFPPAVDATTAALLRDLAERIARDAAISPAFAALWRRCAAPTLDGPHA